ncbi:MAG: nitroreductase family deazaflavin-dependent oxidoreductase [Dehalococcoidia bacterium]
MTSPEQEQEAIVDSPTGWVAAHIRSYVESNGGKGAVFQGVPALLLTTRGRRSGTLRRTALYYGQDRGRYLLVASNGGSRQHPAWYLNLAEQPEVDVQVGPETFRGLARTATTEERPELWRQMASIFPLYDTYQGKAGRQIPLVIVERA